LALLDEVNPVVWGPLTLWLLGLTGVYLMVGLRFMPLTHIGDGFRQAVASIRSSKGEGDVTAFESLSTALAATIGTGNVAGVAGAIAVGGPMDFIRNGLGPAGPGSAPSSPSSAPLRAPASATACRPMRWPWR
jgi:hypothetical protein